MASNVEITIDSPRNSCAYFRPLDRSVRGRFMLSRVKEPTAMSFRDRIPEDVAGQTIGIDTDTGTGYLMEPLHQDERVKAYAAKRGKRLEPARQEFAGVEVNAWLFWMRRLVDSGLARVVNGKLPETVEYDPPPRFGKQPKRGNARLREIFQRHPDVAAQYSAWTKDQRTAWEQLVGV